MRIINPIYSYSFEINYEEGYEYYHKDKTFIYPNHNVIKVLSSKKEDCQTKYYITIYTYDYIKMVEVLSNFGVQNYFKM